MSHNTTFPFLSTCIGLRLTFQNHRACCRGMNCGKSWRVMAWIWLFLSWEITNISYAGSNNLFFCLIYRDKKIITDWVYKLKYIDNMRTIYLILFFVSLFIHFIKKEQSYVSERVHCAPRQTWLYSPYQSTWRLKKQKMPLNNLCSLLSWNPDYHFGHLPKFSKILSTLL